jgi:hypothetical protein
MAGTSIISQERQQLLPKPKKKDETRPTVSGTTTRNKSDFQSQQIEKAHTSCPDVLPP